MSFASRCCAVHVRDPLYTLCRPCATSGGSFLNFPDLGSFPQATATLLPSRDQLVAQLFDHRLQLLRTRAEVGRDLPEPMLKLDHPDDSQVPLPSGVRYT